MPGAGRAGSRPGACRLGLSHRGLANDKIGGQLGMDGGVLAGAFFDMVEKNAHGDAAHFADRLFDGGELGFDDGGDGVVAEAYDAQLIGDLDAAAFGVEKRLDRGGIVDAEDRVGRALSGE